MEKLAVSYDDARQMVHRGQLPCVRFGPKKVRFIPDEIEAIVEQRRVGLKDG